MRLTGPRFLATATTISGVAGAAVLWLAFREAPARGQLYAEPPSLEFGPRTQGEQIVVTVSLINGGNQLVELTSVMSSCSCGTAAVGERKLMPGESTPLEIRWSLRNARGRSQAAVMVRYRLPDDEEGELAISLGAEVIPDYEYTPATLAFRRGTNGTQTIHFEPKGLDKLTLGGVQCTNGAFQAAIDPSSKTVSVTFSHAAWSDVLSSEPKLMVETNSPNQRVCVIPIRVE